MGGKKRVARTSKVSGWSLVPRLLRRYANRFAEANQERQLWMSGLRIEERTHLKRERSVDRHEKRQ